MGHNVTDRRRNRRHTFVQPVELTSGETRICSCWSRDLGYGGLQLQLLPIPIASRVSLQLPLPRGGAQPSCKVQGQVAWRSLGGIGIEFDEVPAELERYVRWLTDGILDDEGEPANAPS